MEPKQILHSPLLDIIFDGRNKAYGAYDLRVTYPQRIKRSLLVVFIFLLLAFSGFAFASTFGGKDVSKPVITEVTLTEIEQEEKEPEPIPEPERQPEPQQVRTEQYTIPIITDDQEVQEPPPTQEDLTTARIDVTQTDGIDDGHVAEPPLDGGREIIIEKEPEETDIIHSVVQVPASYEDNWAKFLLRNLRAEVPVDNGAPAGKYTVLIQFVVDKEGHVSDLKPVTAHGYGMEEEAIRVLKKSKAWNPGIQDGRPVKSYHRQPITFEVVAE